MESADLQLLVYFLLQASSLSAFDVFSSGTNLSTCCNIFEVENQLKRYATRSEKITEESASF